MGTFPEPRGFQLQALESLREGIRAGHKNQCVMAPTGAGKTFIAMQLIDKALAKGKRCAFLCDRVTLINQTSDVAHRYGLGNHGIIQADNPRLNLSKQFQIASVQTLARRGWPEFDLIIVDECHTLYKTWVEYVGSPECTAKVVGLSATPFSKGMAYTFTNLVNAATMHDLTQLGVLVPMRIFPIFGQGMTVASREANALDNVLKTRRSLSGLSRAFYKQAVQTINTAWMLATGEDFRYSETEGVKPFYTNLLNKYTLAVHHASARDTRVYGAFIDVMNMLKPPTVLFAPDIVWRVLRANKATQQQPETNRQPVTITTPAR